MTPRIAIVGMACRYPDARSPEELWENVLSQRRSFRRIPSERLCLDDYFSSDRRTPDTTYSTQAALIEGYEFDRIRFRVAGSTFRTTDMTHWLSLDIASQALEDAGFPEAKGLPREATGVIVGNTLTGDSSRASVMRLRWPYVRRAVDAALGDRHWERVARDAFLGALETTYKSPFPEVGADTLAGGLSNTIAGRICNHFDFGGGGYTVDGACCSSLLAVANACSALMTEDIQVALVGGVDLSIDPFELVGFAKNQALATDDMRVYDARPQGFWPGEGCGFVVLMRHTDAVALGLRIYALVCGWGISSDGGGGLTRPKLDGQRLALERAYRRAGFGIESVPLFEGHGTGTSVGDEVELDALSAVRRQAAVVGPAAVVGSIKANIGHAKAAAGIAGLIKATLAIHHQVLPPSAGWETPHPRLTGAEPMLRLLKEAEPWDPTKPLRAGVSSMGFGGINAHVTLEGNAAERRTELSSHEIGLSSSPQDAEVFLFGAPDSGTLIRHVERISQMAPHLSLAELGDVASQLAHLLKPGQIRAAVVASRPANLSSNLKVLLSWLRSGAVHRVDVDSGIFLGSGYAEPRIVFLFPGQAGPARPTGGVWRRRFDFVQQLYSHASFATDREVDNPAAIQPAIVTSSLAALRALKHFGIEAGTAVGHSLGELTGLCWAGAIDELALLRIAAARSRLMVELGKANGAMASVEAGESDVEALFESQSVAISCVNSPRQITISGEIAAVDSVIIRARDHGWRAVRLPVTHAFHSPFVAPVVPALARCLATETFLPLKRSLVSSVTGAVLTSDEDLRMLLCRQVTAPVVFSTALALAAERADLLIEAGPGEVLTRLAGEIVETPAVALDAGGSSLVGLLKSVGLAFSMGAPVKAELLFAGRFVRPFDLDWRPKFLANPCELAPASPRPVPMSAHVTLPQDVVNTGGPYEVPEPDFTLEPTEVLRVVKELVAEKAELPVSEVKNESRLLDDFHLNSITVGEIASEGARRFNLSRPIAPTEYAGSTVGEMARALQSLLTIGSSMKSSQMEHVPAGAGHWIRNFVVEWTERPLLADPCRKFDGPWHVIAPDNHDFAASLKREIAPREGFGGTVFCVLPDFEGSEDTCIELLLESARILIAATGPARFVLVSSGGCGGSFARTLHLEIPNLTTLVVDIPFEDERAAQWVLGEVLGTVGFRESQYDSQGRRHEPFLRLLAAPYEPTKLPLVSTDVLLVTGGGKGIAAECASALARETGVCLALLGRSEPAAEPELKANLERLSAAGIRFRYICADVSDAIATKAAIREIEKTVGTVTAVIHGAGTNNPQPVRLLDKATVSKTIACKVHGLRNVLSSLDSSNLKLLVTFGSLIAKSGMPGEADYALANEWLARLTERWEVGHPHCHCVAVEWSVWSGMGMGERLGRIDALAQQGISAISPDQGVAQLKRLVAVPPSAVSVVVSSRFGETSTLKMERPQIPLLRFLERPRVHYPGIELVIDSQLTLDSDPYLRDHVFQGRYLFPAVMGLEAMAQAAMCITNQSSAPVFENVRFAQPISVPVSAPLTLRVAALVKGPGIVDVVVRSSQSAFQIDHFCATCRFTEAPHLESHASNSPGETMQGVPLVPDRDLYDGLLFQTGRFRRICNYRKLAARECIAEIASTTDNRVTSDWFGPYLPPSLVLGDAGARDAVVHALQACVPNAPILPIGIDRLSFTGAPPSSMWIVQGVERTKEGSVFTYDVDVTDMNGCLLERWEGLKLQLVGAGEKGAKNARWVEPLLGPYLERQIPDLVHGMIPVSVVVDHYGTGERRLRTDRAIQRALGTRVPVSRRADGKPEVPGDQCVSAAHAGEITIAVAGHGTVACDAELVASRSVPLWRDLLGPDAFALAQVVAQQVSEGVDASATRVWTASECMKKAGAGPMLPFMFSSATVDGWVVFNAGRLAVATFLAPIRTGDNDLALAVLTGSLNGNL